MAGGKCQNSCSFFIHASQNFMLHNPPDTTVPIYPGLGLELGVHWLVVPRGEGYPSPSDTLIRAHLNHCLTYHACLWDLGGNRNTWRKSMRTQGEKYQTPNLSL